MTAPESNPDIADATFGCMQSVAQHRATGCRNSAIAIAKAAAASFIPTVAGIPEVKWCGPQGQAPPPISFPKDFIDRRTTVAWALERMTLSTPVDEPIFSAQARVTTHRTWLATFSNFNAPAATVISNVHSVEEQCPVELPDAIVSGLKSAAGPIVYVVFNHMASFDDVIFYTSVFNFARAFAAFQTGPWRSLKQSLAECQLEREGFSLIERRAIERGALAAVGQAWEASWQQPLDRIKPTLVDLVSRVQ